MTGNVIVFNRYPLGKSFHLKTKFDGQVEGFRDLGLIPGILCFDDHSFYINSEGKKERIGAAHTRLPFFFHLFYYIEAGKRMSKYLQNSHHIQMLYYRSGPCFYSLYKMARIAHEQGIQVVCELPSYYADGKRGEKQLSVFRTVYKVIWEYWQRKMDRHISLYALIGDKNESGVYRGRPSIDISNAINVKSLPLRKPVSDSKIHILALGTMGEYHGFDRLIRSAAQYKGNRDYILHFVGNNAGGCLEKWKALSTDLGVENVITFHGPLYGEELDQMFNICDIGVSSLGAYRLGVQSLASLKLREYAARGLPFVYSADDSAIDDIKECSRFAYKIPNNDSVPDMEAILQFAMNVKNEPDLPSYERQYATTHMQWQEQFAKILNKLAELKEPAEGNAK